MIQKRELSEREQWFIDRIGKTIYRNKTSCTCDTCKRVYEEGLIMRDEQHASYVSDIEAISNAEHVPLRYFDTIEERDEFEKTLENAKI